MTEALCPSSAHANILTAKKKGPNGTKQLKAITIKVLLASSEVLLRGVQKPHPQPGFEHHSVVKERFPGFGTILL